MNSLSKKRLFIAIPYKPSASVQRFLQNLRMRAADQETRMRVIADSNLHITLKFMGMVPETEITSVQQVIDQLISSCQAFEMTFKGLGCFRNSLWLGVEQSDELQCLVTCLEDGLTVLGFAAEARVFVPHITLVRIGRESNLKLLDLQKHHSDTSWGSMRAEVVHLYESKTLPSGAEYSILHSSMLGA